MNTNLLSIVKQIITDNGEAVLENPRRIKAFFNDKARDEPKPLCTAFCCCIEADAYTALKTADDAAERSSRKASIAQKVRDEHGTDPAFSAWALDILEAAIFGEGQTAPQAAPQAAAAPAQKNAAPQPPSAPVCAGCGAELKANWKACPECGAPVQQAAVCAGCGAELKANWKACPECGAPVQAAAQAVNSGGGDKPDGNFLDKGILFANRGDYEMALDAFTEAIRLHPQSADAYMLRGKALMANISNVDNRRGDFNTITFAGLKEGVPAARIDEAIADFNRAIQLDPRLAAAYLQRGHAYGFKGDNDKAIADYTRAIEIDPDNAKAYANRGLAYYNKEDWDRAIADFTQAIKLNLDDAKVYYFRGNAYRNKGDNDRAIADYTQAIKLNLDDATVYYFRGFAYHSKEDWDRAIADYTQAIKLNLDDAMVYYFRGFAYHSKEDWDRAIADYTRAIELDPNNTWAKDRLREIRGNENQAITQDLDNAGDYINRGHEYSINEDYDRAIAAYTRAIELDPDDAAAYEKRGDQYYINGEKDRAIADYTRAIELDPNNTWAKEMLREIRGNENQAITLDLDDAAAYSRRGEACRMNGQYDAAIKDFDAAIRLDPNYAWAYARRGAAYNQKGQKNQAMADLEKAVNLDPNNTWAKDRLREIRGNENRAASADSSGGCFITSAVCGSFAKPDDCYELTLFRQFRDGWLAQQPDGPALIEQYYRTAPAIVAAIDRRPDRDAVYRSVWDAHLSACLRLIQAGRFAECKAAYQNMVHALAETYW